MATQYTAGLTAGQVLTAATMNQIGAAWETWAPVVAQPGGIAGTVNFARYTRIQKLVIGTFSIAITGAGTAGNALSISLPITANTLTAVHGSGLLYDASATTMYNGTFYNVTSTAAWFIGDWASVGVWGTIPGLGIANGDVWRGTFVYEAA